MIPFIETFLEIFISFVDSPKLEKKLLEWFLFPFVNYYLFNKKGNIYIYILIKVFMIYHLLNNVFLYLIYKTLLNYLY